MAQVITTAGEQLFAIKAQNNQPLDIDTFIFAYVPGQDSSADIDRNEGLPPVGQRVHQQIVQQRGRVNSNVVIYSTVLDSVTGPFEFNWVGLYSSVNNTLVAISKIPTVVKTVTVPGTAGNILNRNFGIEYSGIADLDGITVDPETWQLDYTARLNGMDELTRQLAADMNGRDWFIDNGFKVEPLPTPNNFKVTAGAGYVSGLRIAIEEEPTLIAASYPQFVYVNAWFDGTAETTWKGQTTFQITPAEQEDYTDETGKRHYLFKLATITAADTVIDHRRPSGLRPHKSIKGLQPIPEVVQKAEAYVDGTGVGGGDFTFYPGMSEAMHNGGFIIAKNAVEQWSGELEDIDTILEYSGNGNGCYVRDKGPEDKYSVTDFGANPYPADSTKSFSKSAQSAPSSVTIRDGESDLWPRTPTKILTVPEGRFLLTELVDTGNEDVIWHLKSGSSVDGSQYLNGRVVRDGQRVSNGGAYGTSDYATSMAVRMPRRGEDLNDGSEVIGLSDPSKLATYKNRDLVSLFVDIKAPKTIHSSPANYTLNSIILNDPLTDEAKKYIRKGMIIDTAGTRYSGVISGWSSDFGTIFVTAWYLYGSNGEPAIPANGLIAHINPVTRVWGANVNIDIPADSFARSGVAAEFGVVNNKEDLDEVWIYDGINQGPFKIGCIYNARGPASAGFQSIGQDVGLRIQDAVTRPVIVVSGDDTTYVVANSGSMEVGRISSAASWNLDAHTSGNTNDYDVRLQARGGQLQDGKGEFAIGARRLILNIGEPAFVVSDDGRMEIGLPSVNSSSYIDMHSSGNSNDYDTRILSVGGGPSFGQAELNLKAGKVIVPEVLPEGDGQRNLGAISRRFDTIFAATGSINTSDEREKTELQPINDTEKLIARELLSHIAKFKFKSAVSIKGDRARNHIGIGAQTVKGIFEKYGLNGFDYGILCFDEWEMTEEVTEKFEYETEEGETEYKHIVVKERADAGNRYGIRYEELIMFMLSSLAV